MNVVWGIVLAVLGLLAWGGQTLSWVAPGTAARLGLTESEEQVEPAFHADVRGEAAWDAFTLWALPVAGVLLAIDQSAWAYFGLAAGAIYTYFAGRGVFTRIALRRRGLRIGSPSTVTSALAFLVVWGVVGLVTVVAATRALAT